MSDRIYKIVPSELWELAEREGVFQGATIDHADGFIHFSAADQVAETARRHFGGQTDLVLVAAESDLLADRLKWETSRGGAAFPHLYGSLEMSAVVFVKKIPVDAEGQFDFSSLLA